MLEMTNRDCAGRICKFALNGKTITTPNIAVVVNPRKQIIPVRELKDFKADLAITNAFIIESKKDKIRGQIIEEGLHGFFGFNGIIMTDSGAFQAYSQKVRGIDPKKILAFQKKIGSDVVTPVDVFTFPDDRKDTARKKLRETLKRIKAAKAKHLSGPIQGGTYLDLRKQASRAVARLDPEVFAIGGIVPLMEQYRFKELCDIIITCKQNLPANKPVHAFGAGHPMIFALLTALGCDIFDSAMYHIAARRGGYLTINGTYSLEDLKEFPCSCPECIRQAPQEIKKSKNSEEFLARHNLYVTFQELRTIRQAIRDKRLIELVQTRCRAHPNILEAWAHVLKKHGKWIMRQNPVSKPSAFFYSGKESEYRPEVLRAKEWLKRVRGKKYFLKEPFGRVPIELKGVYPFGQSIIPGSRYPKQKAGPEDIVRRTLDYQFGKGNGKRIGSIDIEVSRKTRRIRRVKRGKILLGTIRASDGFFVPSKEGAKSLKMKKIRIKDKEVAGLVSEGKSVFAKFVDTRDDVLPGEEVLVVDKRGKVLAVGRSMLNKKEISEFDRGIAVRVRG